MEVLKIGKIIKTSAPLAWNHDFATTHEVLKLIGIDDHLRPAGLCRECKEIVLRDSITPVFSVIGVSVWNGVGPKFLPIKLKLESSPTHFVVDCHAMAN